jgi:ribosomal protein L11 methyltransferase
LGNHPALELRYGPGAGLLQDLLYAELDAFEPLAIQEDETAGGWRVFFRTSTQRDGARAALAAALGNRLLALSAIEVEDEGWARRSQASLTPIRAGRFIIAPPWAVPTDRDSEPGIRDSRNAALKARYSPDSPDSPDSPSPESRVPDPDTITIIIEPSMGFGTGHHATTRMCLELLQQIEVQGTRVIDVGTGSGILALAAWKLGASIVVAIDHDPDALQNARDNIARNGGTGIVELVEADLAAMPARPADVVLANLTAAALERHASALKGMIAERGALVASGFSPEELDGVACAFGLVPRHAVREGDWAAAMF